MNKPLELRFIPKWLDSAVRYHQAGYANFESIVSRHDFNLYKVANNAFQTQLKRMLIDDFVLPSAELSTGFTEDDMLFALYGPNPERLTVAAWELTDFHIAPDLNGGILVIEGGGHDNNLVLELLLAVALYQGKACAYKSSSFKRYLRLVNNNVLTVAKVAANKASEDNTLGLVPDHTVVNLAEAAQLGV